MTSPVYCTLLIGPWPWRDLMGGGDYGVFASLLKKDGVTEDKVTCLEQAAFFERTFNLSDARQKAQTLLPMLEKGLPGAGALFAGPLQERLRPVLHFSLYDRQRDLAQFYLKNGDYPRAAIFAYEAFLTSLLDQHEQPADYEARAQAEQDFHEGRRGDFSLRVDFLKLEKIRNTLAHGNCPKKKAVRQIIRNPQRLKNELQGLMKRLLIP